MRPILLSALVGFGLSSAAVVTLVLRHVHHALTVDYPALRRFPTLVAVRDLPAHATLTAADLRTQARADGLVAGWAVPQSDRPLVIGKELTLPLQAGDPLRWANFARVSAQEELDACAARLEPIGEEEARRAGAGVAARYQPLPVEPSPVRPAPGSGMVQVVVAATDLKHGTLLDTTNLQSRAIPAELVTDSIVRAEDAMHLLGARLTADHLSGDPILYQFVERPGRPRMPWSCFQEATKAADSARLAARRVAAKEYFEQRTGAR